MTWFRWICDRCYVRFRSTTIERHCVSCRVHGPLLVDMGGE